MWKSMKRNMEWLLIVALLVGAVMAVGCGKGEETPPENYAPVAALGADQTVAFGNAVSLDGRGSSDPDGDAITYTWSFDYVPVGSALDDTAFGNQNGSATAGQLTFVPDKVGSYVIGLQVSDGTEVSTPVYMVVNVTSDNLPPIANAGDDFTGTTGSRSIVDGSASRDPDSSVTLEYFWTLTSKPAGSALIDYDIYDATTDHASIVPDVDGPYVLSLVVNDGMVNSNNTATVTITVGGGTPAYVTTLQNALANNSFLVAHSSALNGLLELYEFGPVGPGGSMFYAYISPMSAPTSRTGDWSVTDGGGYAVATDLYSIPRALNSAAPVNLAAILTMTGYPNATGSLQDWIKVAPVTSSDFAGKTATVNGGSAPPRYVFAVNGTGEYRNPYNTATPNLFTWTINSLGNKAVLTFANGSSHHLYLTVQGAGGSVVREMAVVTVASDGVVTSGSLLDWVW